MTNIILKCCAVEKTYKDGALDVSVLHDLDLEINKGEKVAIVGPSGSGKSTLLHLLGGLDHCSKGDVLLNDRSWSKMTEVERCNSRNKDLGFVYQFHHLLPEFSALENVMMPLLINRKSTQESKQLALESLELLGLKNRISHKPGQLSGGERQRVAIARAVVMKPACILADEPTGNLDSETANDVFKLFLSLNQQINTALVVVTHDLSLAAKMDRQLNLNKGKLAYNKK